MYLTRLDLKIGWLLFLDYLKELREYWERTFHLTEEQLGSYTLVPGYQMGYVK